MKKVVYNTVTALSKMKQPQPAFFTAYKFDKRNAQYVGISDKEIVALADEITSKDKMKYSHGKMPNCS